MFDESFNGYEIISGPNFGELNICTDNCEGQNNNKIFIWHVLGIIEKVLFPRVNTICLLKDTQIIPEISIPIYLKVDITRDFFTYK